jgi:hypothetical protein
MRRPRSERARYERTKVAKRCAPEAFARAKDEGVRDPACGCAVDADRGVGNDLTIGSQADGSVRAHVAIMLDSRLPPCEAP